MANERRHMNHRLLRAPPRPCSTHGEEPMEATHLGVRDVLCHCGEHALFSQVGPTLRRSEDHAANHGSSNQRNALKQVRVCQWGWLHYFYVLTDRIADALPKSSNCPALLSRDWNY